MASTSNVETSENPLANFDVMSTIGTGFYEAVYKARNLRTSEYVAIKVMKSNTENDARIIQNEVLMIQACRHPNIVSFYGSCLNKSGKLLVFMEYAGGGSLEDICYETGSLSELQVAFICRETLQGLSYLHSMGKMHRDIKGANILLTDSGDVKIGDFGLVAELSSSSDKRHSFVGAPYWMAPEVASVERKGGYNHLCDIFSLGITAIELAEPQHSMFMLDREYALFIKTRSGFKSPALEHVLKWSAEFSSFVKAALTKNPRKRPTADQLLKHPFFERELSKKITFELLHQYHNSNQHNEMGNESTAASLPQCIPIMASNSNTFGKYQQLTTDQSSSSDIISRDILFTLPIRHAEKYGNGNTINSFIFDAIVRLTELQSNCSSSSAQLMELENIFEMKRTRISSHVR